MTDDIGQMVREEIAKAVKDAIPSRDRLIDEFYEEAKVLARAPRKNMRMFRALQDKYLAQDETLTVDDLDVSPSAPDWGGWRRGDGPPPRR